MNLSKLGIGVDIEDIARFKRLSYGRNKKFYEKVFAKNEIKYCLSKRDPAQHFAVRFCAKEAFIKAAGKQISDYKSIEIKFEKKKPFVFWKNKKYLLSLSHDKDKAIAFVIVEP